VPPQPVPVDIAREDQPSFRPWWFALGALVAAAAFMAGTLLA
jgi:hypothetical protein